VIGGLLLLAGGVLLGMRQRHLVVLRSGGGATLRLIAKNPSEQMMILSTVQAVQGASKGSTPAPAAPAPAAPKPVQVDDGGDPVKALQDLSTARAAGKLSEDEFYAKREVLLGRIGKGR
jgi:hypothetical protein